MAAKKKIEKLDVAELFMVGQKYGNGMVLHIIVQTINEIIKALNKLRL